MHAILVTGIGTEVGKTHLGVGLIRALEGLLPAPLTVGAMKPLESGCRPGPEGGLVPADATALWEATGRLDPLERVCPYRFGPPVSPAVAAEWAGLTPELSVLDAAFEALRARHALLLVEGAGGLLSPLIGSLTSADLAARWGLSVLVVVPNTLGCLNAASLTLEVLAGRGLPCLGVVFNRPPGLPSPEEDPSVRDNPGRLAALTGARILGEVGSEPELELPRLARSLLAVLDAPTGA
ncbi:MAG: dethiobiotin synthase [Deltaproteobacteria bacterium]|nr:dethiobiotin synthase [Deltaproteobacteria bacterium]